VKELQETPEVSVTCYCHIGTPAIISRLSLYCLRGKYCEQNFPHNVSKQLIYQNL